MQCEICKKDLNKKQKHFCSKKCFYISLCGSKNPSFQGKLLFAKCKVCNKKFFYYVVNKSGQYCSQACSNLSVERKDKMRQSRLGFKHTEEAKLKMSLARKGVPKSPEIISKIKASTKLYWDKKGRITDQYLLYRTSNKYKKWRDLVFKKDGYSCVHCGDSKGHNLEADHIIPFSVIFEEFQISSNENFLFDVENGRTLCIDCHKKTPTYAKHKSHHPHYKLIQGLKSYWSNLNPSKDFGLFYEREMNRLIEHYKGKLE